MYTYTYTHMLVLCRLYVADIGIMKIRSDEKISSVCCRNSATTVCQYVSVITKHAGAINSHHSFIYLIISGTNMFV